MQMPLNIGEVLKIATDMKEVRQTPLSVSIYIDDTAPGVLAAHVRAAFASVAENTRVTIGYLDDGITHKAADDFTVLVAGEDDSVGQIAQTLRDAGTPVMVVTNSPHDVSVRAEASGFAIPAADVVAPVRLESAAAEAVISKIPFIHRKNADAINSNASATNSDLSAANSNAAEANSNVAEANSDAASASKLATELHNGDVVAIDDDTSIGEVPLDDETLAILDARMGKWLIAACKHKDLALAYSFPFVRRPLAQDAITSTSLQNGAVGLVPIIPGADMPIMTLNQVKMTLQIATAYGQPLDKERIKEICAVVGGAFVCRHLVRSATKFVPFAGWLISGGMGYAATEAMGRALLEYFEAGGDIVGVASVMQTARDASKDAYQKVAASPLGQDIISKAKSVAGAAIAGMTK